MTTITSGAITSTQSVYNGQQANLIINFDGNAYAGYAQLSLPVFNPAGFISKPMPGRMALMHLTPNGTTGHISGFANELPDPETSTNNVADIVNGESAIVETSGFNFNIKAKVDKLLSTFENSNNQKIDSSITIGQNVVTALKDVFAEIVAFEAAYNNFISNDYNLHTHPVTGVQAGSDTVTSGETVLIGTPYTPTPNFTRDNNFLTQSPSKMYIDLNGELIA